MKHLKRIIAWLLITVMVSSTVPASALHVVDMAEETVAEGSAAQEEGTAAAETAALAEDVVAEEALTDMFPEALEEEAAGVSDTPQSQTHVTAQTQSVSDSAVLAEDETPAAYEISYNVSGGGEWMTVGSDGERAQNDGHYAQFGSDGNYVIQMRNEDTFPYTVEMRYRMGENDAWSVPEKVTFSVPCDTDDFTYFEGYPEAKSNPSGSVRKFQGHVIGAQSKWLTEIRYSISGGDYLEPVSLGEFDENGNYAIPLEANQIHFPLYLSFQYRRYLKEGELFRSGWTTARSGDGSQSFVFRDMNSTVNICGREFSLKAAENTLTPGVAQYRISSGRWITVGPGAGTNYQFDENGNYAIDMGGDKDFPVKIYLRYLGTNGWEYLDGASNLTHSYHQFENVLDTATISGHTFSIYTNWMQNVQYAYLDSNGNFPANGVTWITVDSYDNNGNYVIYVGSNSDEWNEENFVLPVKLAFRSINPKGGYEDHTAWDADTLTAHTKTFETLSDEATWEGHGFSLRNVHQGELRYTLYYGYHSAENFQGYSKAVLCENRNHASAHNNRSNPVYYGDVFDKDGNYTIDLEPENRFPLHMEAKWMTETGWQSYTLDVSELSQLETEIALSPVDSSQDVPNHQFIFHADFLDDVRYKRSSSTSWTYIIPVAEEGDRRSPGERRWYYDYDSDYVREYEADGGYTFNLSESDKFVPADGTGALEHSFIIQKWDYHEGWTPDTPAPFTDSESTHSVTTVAGNEHTFRLHAPLTNEVRYRYGSGNWITLGSDQERAESSSSYFLWDENGNYSISLLDAGYDADGLFPLNARFQAYTKYGWQDAYVKVKGAETETITTGSGTFEKAASVLIVSAAEEGTDAHEFSVYWPWANSVRYALTGAYYESSDVKPPVVGFIGPNAEYAEKDPTYFYAESGSEYPLDLPEGYFFPVQATFTAIDESGNLFDHNAANEQFEHEFTTNLSSETYVLSDGQFPFAYTFSVNSNWVGTADEEGNTLKEGTIRIYLPESEEGKNDAVTISVGDGKDPNGNDISEEWLKNNPTYQVFNADGSFVIPLRPNETFPLTVEFMQRSFRGDPHPERKTFKNLNSYVDFAEHRFYLTSRYTDTVRYVTAYGAQRPDLSNAVTVVGDQQWVKNHNDPQYASFGSDGSYRIPLDGDNDALPVDVWYMLPTDSNGEYSGNNYKKFTFTSRNDSLNLYTVTVDEVSHGSIELAELNDLPALNKQSAVAAPGDTVTLEVHNDPDYNGKSAYAYWTVDSGGQLHEHDLTGQLTFTMPDDNIVITAAFTTLPADAQEAVSAPSPDDPPAYEPFHSFTVYSEWMDEVHFKLPQLPSSANLPESVEITAGPDVARANREKRDAAKENREARYVTYAADGSYTIQLEDDAFFPYVMDVWYRTDRREDAEGQPPTPYAGNPIYIKGQVEFATPDSTVTLNGHVFKVASRRVNPNAAVRINLVVGTHTIPLRLETIHPPQKLEETTDRPVLQAADDVELQSVQPLTEVQLWADLRDSFNLELSNARVEVFLPPDIASQTEKRAERFVWGEWNMKNTLEVDEHDNIIDNAEQITDPKSGLHWKTDAESVAYRVIGPSDKLDLSDYVTSKDQTNHDQYFEVITGSTDPLDLDNIRYVVRTETGFASYNGILKMKFAYADDWRGGVYVYRDGYEYKSQEEINAIGYRVPGLTTDGADAYTYTTEDGKSTPIGVYRITVDETWKDGKLWFTLKPNENEANYSAFKDLSVEIYEGIYLTAEEARINGKRLPDSVWNQELDTQRVKDRYETYTNILNGPKGITDGPQYTVVWSRIETDSNGNPVPEVDSSGNPVFDIYERDENGRPIQETDSRGRGKTDANGNPVYRLRETPEPRYGQPIAIMPFRIIVDVQATNNNNPGQPEQGQNLPVTFAVPHTYKDFIPGVEDMSVELEWITDIYDSTTDLVTSYYWTNTAGNLYDDRYYVEATYNLGDPRQDNIKVYAGQVKYETLSAAQEAAKKTDSSRAMDVTEQIFRENQGFGADYSNEFSNGVVFSVFNSSGALIASRKIVTLRREFLGFGRLSGPGVIDDVDGLPGVVSEMARAKKSYEGIVKYTLPDTEYRGAYEGKAYYTIPITYLRDYVPSSVSEYGVKIVASSQQYSTYALALKGDSEDITGNVKRESVVLDNGETMEDVDVIEYSAAYRRGVYFSLYDKNGNLLDMRYVYAVEQSRGEDTYFEITGARSAGNGGGTQYDAYFMPANMDGYYESGYQTVLLLNRDGSPVTNSKIYPTFDIAADDGSGHQVRIFRGTYSLKAASGLLAAQQIRSGQDPVDFNGDGSDEPVPYTALASDNRSAKNYWVTFLTQQEGPKLFVNTGNQENDGFQREIFLNIALNEDTGNYHDIFIANIGDEDLQNVTVSLENGANSLLKIDEYWRIRNGATISAFTKTALENADVPGRDRYAEQFHTDVQLPNVTKIRVHPKVASDGSIHTAEINDSITISAQGQDPVTIHLSGTIGKHRITTDYITGPEAETPNPIYDDYTKQAVKYVAFSRLIQTDWTYGEDGAEFSIEKMDQTAGSADMAEVARLKAYYKSEYNINLDNETINYRVPDGFPVGYEHAKARANDETQQIRPNGELFGVPLETGWFAFKVKVNFTYHRGEEDEQPVNSDTRIYLLQVLENTTENVEDRISNEYDAVNWIPDIHIKQNRLLSGGNPLTVDASNPKHRGDTGIEEVDGYPKLRLTFQANAQGDAYGIKDYDWVVAIYLNGYLLTPGTDYILNRGSADPTLTEQAFKDYGQKGLNTINVNLAQDANQNSTLKKNFNQNVNADLDFNKTTKTRTVVSDSKKGLTRNAQKPDTVKPVTPVKPGTTTKPTTVTPTPKRGGGGGGGGGTTYYTVTTQTAQNGSFSVSTRSTTAGSTVTITATPDENYRVAAFHVTGTTATRNANDANKASFSMPAANVTVSVTFEGIPHKVNVSGMDYGWLQVSSENAPQGTRIVITPHPEKGYEAKNLTLYDDNGRYLWNEEVNDVSGFINEDGSAGFTMPARNVTLSARFEPIRLASFTDIDGTMWFFDNAVWAYDRNVILGVNDLEWKPNNLISSVTAIVTLARLSKEDLEPFWGDEYAKDWIPIEWYTHAARWGAYHGILTEDLFTGNDPISRGSLAIMLTRFLEYQGVQVTLSDADLVTFPDVPEDLLETFRILRKAGVFLGDSDGKMNPQNNSTRAHLAATLNRLSQFIISYWQTLYN